jgi:hypothetical protein
VIPAENNAKKNGRNGNMDNYDFWKLQNPPAYDFPPVICKCGQEANPDNAPFGLGHECDDCVDNRVRLEDE